MCICIFHEVKIFLADEIDLKAAKLHTLLPVELSKVF